MYVKLEEEINSKTMSKRNIAGLDGNYSSRIYIIVIEI
jgi:hypothetical protein